MRQLFPFALLLVAACAGDEREAWLEDVTDGSGLTAPHALGATGSYFLPEIMGPGCALLDADGDGDLDAYVVNAGPNRSGAANQLFLQEDELRFVDATESSGLGDPGYGMGVAVGDYDSDGDLDVYVTNYGPNALYRNNGDGTFANVTAAMQVGCPLWSCSAAFLDFDADGDLDLFVTNYLAVDPNITCPDPTGRPDYCGPRAFPGVPDVLYRNDGGTFTDVSNASGIGGARRRGLGVVCADLTGDRQLDIYVANDNEPNHLWVNRGDGTFVDEALVRGMALSHEGREEASMGMTCSDLDGDLDLDVFITHLSGESNTAYEQLAPGRFEDRTAVRGLLGPSLPFTGFGVVSFDIEHDGDLDLATVNGRVFRGEVSDGASVSAFWNDYAQAGQLFLNDGKGRFTDTSDRSGSFGREPQVGRGLAAGDVDGDGAVDLLMTATGGRARLFVNRARERGHWLLVRAVDGKRDAVGAVVTLAAGGRQQVRRIDPASSYLSSSDPRAHFGLGPAATYDELTVLWPGGKLERFGGGAANRVVAVERGKGR